MNLQSETNYRGTGCGKAARPALKGSGEATNRSTWKTNRNPEAEKEMIQICNEVWGKIGIGKMPEIQSKQGGSTGAYYPDENIIRFRWNSWNKMPLAGKRMIAIHELYHALGRHHDSSEMFCHAFDILTIELYKLIYGKDEAYKSAKSDIVDLALNIVKYSKEVLSIK